VSRNIVYQNHNWYAVLTGATLISGAIKVEPQAGDVVKTHSSEQGWHKAIPANLKFDPDYHSTDKRLMSK